eukprot:46390-Chlamydomonas_euryale.AAC.3
MFFKKDSFQSLLQAGCSLHPSFAGTLARVQLQTAPVVTALQDSWPLKHSGNSDHAANCHNSCPAAGLISIFVSLGTAGPECCNRVWTD